MKNYIENICSISSASADEFAKIVSVMDIGKGEIFIKRDVSGLREYFLVDGICRSFITDHNGDEITLSFFTPNTAISPSLVRSSSGRSILNIQAVTDVKLAPFETEDLMSLMNSNPEIRQWGNQVLQQELVKKVDKEISQLSMGAKDRLLHFREVYPNLENLIPHGYIASFLGITTVSLSRLRKELMNK